MGIQLLHGRLLDARDVANAPPAVLISESLAKKKFPGQNPLGQRVHVGPTNRPWYSIVGVVGDVKQTSLAESETDAVYLTTEQSWFADDAMSLVVRGRGNVAALAPAIQQAIWAVDKDQAIVRVAMLDGLLAESGAERRFAMILLQAFALVALALAATGIYGVLSRSVTERVREIGVRVAVGASRGDVLRLVIHRWRRVRPDLDPLDLRLQGGHQAVQQLVEDGPLGFEVEIERSPRDVGRLDDVVDAGGVIPLLGEDPARHRQHAGTSRLAQPLRARHPAVDFWLRRHVPPLAVRKRSGHAAASARWRPPGKTVS